MIPHKPDTLIDSYQLGKQAGFNHAVIESIRTLAKAGEPGAVAVLQKHFGTNYDPANEAQTHFHMPIGFGRKDGDDDGN